MAIFGAPPSDLKSLSARFGLQSPSCSKDVACPIEECPECRIDIPEAADPHVDRFLTPHTMHEPMQRCRVRRYRDHSVVELFIESGNIFMLSATLSGREWLICEQPMGQPQPQQQKQEGGSLFSSKRMPRTHIARVRVHADGNFSCIRSRDERAAAPNELLLVRHTLHQLCEDLPKLNTLEAAVPLMQTRDEPTQPGSAPPRPAPGAGVGGARPPGELGMLMRVAGEGREPSPSDVAFLCSKVPKWNSRSETYELPFHGRANLASVRNFQLVDRKRADRVVLLYGKVEEDEFALDYAYPLSMLQALSICLSSSAW